ncbi:MAG TPA: DUF116 domain-containing protein [Candidatus Acidoferrum sp.]|jgi:hypothetical protein
MQALIQSDQISETHILKAGCSDLVYDLRLKDGSSDCFYTDVERFSDKLLVEIVSRLGAVIDGYSHYVRTEMQETPRSRGEYTIEVLMLGMVLCRYAAAAHETPGWIVGLTRGLFRLRRVSPWMKTPADFLRAAVTRVFLVPKIGRAARPEQQPLQGLSRLINWLRATGEFEQEAERLDNWRNFLGTLPEEESEQCLVASMELFDWFQQEAANELGAYTRGVPPFLAGEHCRRGIREDQIFCGKEPVEYQLNMVAAEIMNRGLRQEFAHTPRKVVLVPGCMRGARASTCKARVQDMDIKCAACDPTCPVNHLTRRMRSQGVSVFMVLHSTGFSHWLQRWQREPDCGVTAVACLLNILSGGYEMRARGIASQCVLLDYPGCQKHWHPEGIATAVNQERLGQIVAAT